MAYTFKRFGQMADDTPLSIQSKINGTTLERYLSDDETKFLTLVVSGRGSTSYRIESDDIFGRHGGLFLGSSLSTRIITIRARVKADTNEAYRQVMSKLNLMMHRHQVHKLEFTDDEGYSFYGTCVRVEDEGEESNSQIVEIEFECHDPYKYTDIKSHTTTNAKDLVIDSDLPIIAEEISITFPKSSDALDFTINNTSTDRRIRYKQSGTASSNTIRIRQNKDYIGYIDSVNHIDDLNVRFSHFDEFTVANADQLVVTPAPTSITIKYRGVKL